MNPIVAVITAALAGYLIGRIRPWGRLSDWADEQAHYGRWWVATRPRRVLVHAAMWLTHPIYTCWVWRQHARHRATTTASGSAQESVRVVALPRPGQAADPSTRQTGDA